MKSFTATMQPLASMHQPLGERGEEQEGREGRTRGSRSVMLGIPVPGWKLTVGKANMLWGWLRFCWPFYFFFFFIYLYILLWVGGEWLQQTRPFLIDQCLGPAGEMQVEKYSICREALLLQKQRPSHCVSSRSRAARALAMFHGA